MTSTNTDAAARYSFPDQAVPGVAGGGVGDGRAVLTMAIYVVWGLIVALGRGLLGWLAGRISNRA
jgi:hypothetical protein